MAKSVERQHNTVGGILLAAGAGLRFGMPKVMAHQGTWLRAGVEALSDGGCGDVVVVLGAAIVDVPTPARAVVATNWSAGVSNSVRTGLAAMAEDAAYAAITTVDTPDVNAAVVRRVVQAARSSSSGLARAVYGGRPGHPVVIARRHWPQLRQALRGDEGAGPFLKARDDVVAVDCADLASGEDVDEP
ncbi:nucleotidyltransferase family protein [Mycolicibacterium vaccae]|uniref:nucleotidyltransferase family protein n=1 Tax=Mycolicibacterium vaccae TaxID=1810 RepID=UPI003CEBAAB9